MFTLDALKRDGFSWHAALSLASASKLTYESESLVANVAKTSWGFEDCRFIDIGETQGFIANSNDVVLLAFRGTESLGDWLGNLRLLSTGRPYGVVHSGFLAAYLIVQGQITSALTQAGASQKRLLVAGHSLGGALAAIFAAEERSRFNIRGIYTFGQPRTGKGEFVPLFADHFPNQYFRFVNDDDIVPRVPPGYSHVGKLIHFDAQGNVQQAANEAAAGQIERPSLSEPEFFELQRQVKEVQLGVVAAGGRSDSEAVDASLEGLFPSISDHAMDRYIAAIRRFATNTAAGEAVRLKTTAQIQVAARVSNVAARVSAVETAQIAAAAKAIPVLLRLNNSEWKPPAGLRVNSQFGCIVSAVATPEQLQHLEQDEAVAGIDASREGGVYELSTSVPFVGGDVVHRPPIDERGANALVGLIDSGIDILHDAFRDAQGATRILAIWNQRENVPNRSPQALDAAFQQAYGTLYTARDIQAFIAGGQTVPTALRDPEKHGTHVASIAAGRAVGALADGIAPEAGIIVVIPNMKTEAGQAASLGYSLSHVDALHFLKTAVAGGNVVCPNAMPMAVNVSLGMNAGAHDGTSTLEAAFDSISTSGHDRGFVIVKSAGNERGLGGHVRLRIAPGFSDVIAWESSTDFRFQDYLEVWYSSRDALTFELVDPAGHHSGVISSAMPQQDVVLGGNHCQLRLTELHRDNGDNLLAITILSQAAPLQAGAWMLNIVGVNVQSGDGFVDVWLERDDLRPTRFQNGTNQMTLSIPGTANTVITVSACEASAPIRLVPSSSNGPTRDNRPKPDLCAPGFQIKAAGSNTTDTKATAIMTGTSMAAPHVTGAIALALSRRVAQMQQQAGLEQFNARQLRQALIRSSKNFNAVHNEAFGYGALDIAKFMTSI